MNFLLADILGRIQILGKRTLELERWRNYELCTGNFDSGIANWEPRSKEAFHAEREARKALRSAVIGLSWELDQNKEYY